MMKNPNTLLMTTEVLEFSSFMKYSSSESNSFYCIQTHANEEKIKSQISEIPLEIADPT